MKRTWSIFLAFVIIFTFVACSSKNSGSKSLLTSVLNSDKTFITEKGEAVLLKNYVIDRGDLAEQLFANPTEYSFVDFDNDKIDEMVINISSDYGAYLVIRYNGLDVYGYEFRARALQSLKADGSFMSSGGAASNYYCRLAFEDNKANVIYTAIKDSTMNQFELDGNECSIEELNEYINDWDLKEPVKWVQLKSTTDITQKDQFSDTDAPTQKDQSSGTDTPAQNVSNTSNHSAKINLNNYITVEFNGANLGGYAYVTFNKEQFLLDHIGNISFNKENLQVYRELYGDTDTSAANAIIKYISVSLDKRSNLSNGDTIKTVWKIDTEKVDTYFEWDCVCTSKSFTVSGLKDASTFDPFEGVKITFSGTAPFGKASVSDFGSYYDGTYTVTPDTNLKNGDKVKVTYSCSDKATMIANYGKYPSSYEKIYTVSGLNSYVQSISTLSKEQQNKLVSDAREKIWVRGYGNYKQAKYCGYYFYTAKDKEVVGPGFLKWCGTPVGNTICFVFEYPIDTDDANSPTAYLVITLENLLINEKGELLYNRHDMEQEFITYDSRESLNKAFNGISPDLVYCSNNTKFD